MAAGDAGDGRGGGVAGGDIRPTNTAAVGANPSGVAVSDTKIYVVNQASNTVSVIDRANPTATPVTIGVVASPMVIALGPQGSNRAYVTGYNGVSVLNTATNQVVGAVSLTGGQSYGIAVSPDGQRVYVTTSGTNGVAVINANTTTNTYTLASTVAVGATPGGDSAQHRWQPRLCGQLRRQYRVGAQHQRYRHADSGFHSRGGRQPVRHRSER